MRSVIPERHPEYVRTARAALKGVTGENQIKYKGKEVRKGEEYTCLADGIVYNGKLQ